MSMNSATSFWKRLEIEEEQSFRCLQALQDEYVGYRVREFEDQGYCSLTLEVSVPHDCTTNNDKIEGLNHDIQIKRREFSIVQIRPKQHALNIGITQVAKQTYPSLAPIIRQLDLKLPDGLCVYEMQRMPGTPLSRLLHRHQIVDSSLRKNQERLVMSFAALIAQGWLSHLKVESQSRITRADSPMEEIPDMLSRCMGRVGSSISNRLEKLSNELPDTLLRQRTKAISFRVQQMENYPVVLNHGDLIPSNILVHEDTWEITGLIDWAEAEYLPFGTCLYGLEHLLGYLLRSANSSSSTGLNELTAKDTTNFAYYDSAARLRGLFWSRLFEIVPEIKMRQDDVRVMRDLGVLLWYGYAWDDGAIERVVNERDDAVEVACLRSFLNLRT
jgi:hypothetical protein